MSCLLFQFCDIRESTFFFVFFKDCFIKLDILLLDGCFIQAVKERLKKRVSTLVSSSDIITLAYFLRLFIAVCHSTLSY